jgi:hypothetical protein
MNGGPCGRAAAPDPIGDDFMKVHMDGPFFTFLTQSRYPLGIIVLMPEVESLLDDGTVGEALLCHAMGYWGQVDDDLERANDEALKEGGPLMSLWRRLARETPFRIITEADRRNTFVMLESEYPEYEAGRVCTLGRDDG